MRFASFEYWPDQKVTKAYGLSYAFYPNQAYEFEYNRSRLFIDTRFFNQPVAVKKIAILSIRNFILDLKKKYYDVDLITFNNKTRFEIDKTLRYGFISDNFSLYRVQYNTGVYHYIFIKMVKDISINYDDIFFNKIKDLYVNQDTSALRINHLYINHDVSALISKYLNIDNDIQAYHDHHNNANADNGFGIYFPTKQGNINKILDIYCANPIGNIVDQIIVTTEDIVASKYENPIVSRDIHELDKQEDTIVSRDISELHKNKSIDITKEDPIVSVIKKLIITPEIFTLNQNDNINVYHSDSENINVFDSFLVEESINKLNIYENTEIYKSLSSGGYMRIFNIIAAHLRDKNINYNKPFSVEKEVNANTIYWKYILESPNINNTLFYDNKFDTSRKDINTIVNETPILTKNIININFFIQESLYNIDTIKYITDIDTVITSAPDKIVDADNNNKLLARKDNNYYLYKDNSINLKRSRLWLDQYKSLLSILREKYKLKFEKEIIFLKRSKIGLGEHNNFADTSLYKIKYDMDKKIYNDIYFELYTKGLIRDEFLSFSNKTTPGLVLDNNGFSITKMPRTTNDYVFDGIIDFCRNYYNVITDSINAPLIPVSKVYGNALTDDVIAFMKKYHKAEIETENIFNERINKKPTWLEYDEEWVVKNQKSAITNIVEIGLLKLAFNAIVKNQTWLLKNPKHAFMDYFMSWSTKLAKDTYMDHMIIHGIKNIHDIKNNKNNTLDNILWLSKKSKYTQLNKLKVFDLIPKNTTLFKITEILKKRHGLFSIKSLWIEKIPKICYYKNAIKLSRTEYPFEYHNDFLARMEKPFEYHNDFLARMEKPITYYYDFVAISNETLRKLIYDDYDKNTYKKAKDTIAQEVEINNWAWVYEEEPFEPAYGIDELLLPENDIRYKDFEDIIWDRETCTPRFPIEEIDDYTFIARFPNKYPMRDNNDNPLYEEIARAYYGVKEENYYGIRLAIMRKVFLAYYTIWQNRIFEFAQMDITQACNRMLDYLYNWILGYFPRDDIPHALRVFRQIRWYMESAIIEDSRYKITYVPNELTSGALDINEMPIENSLGINSTMYIDTHLHVIRSSPSFLRYDVWFEMYIFNKRTTSFSFSLATNTPVEVYINDNLIDTINHTGVKYVYSLPYTGMKNTIKIFKSGANNIDNMFYIGNIVIPDMGKDGELTIEFDNSKKLGNKALNGVSQKVKAYTNLMSDTKFWEQLMKGNMALQDVYDKIQEYWNIHWRNQQKGKRLTIKRT